jgi:hypothetical protein
VSKLGVYVCSYNQPVFLRHCLLQILLQSRHPDVLSIHENGDHRSYRGMVEDVLDLLEARGVEVVYKHTPASMVMPTFFAPALQALIDEDCDLYQKVDVDDIIYWNHLERQMLLMRSGEYDIAMNTRAELLVLPTVGHYRHNHDVDFGIWNPTGAHPNNIIFNRAVADAFVTELKKPSGENDDAVFAAKVMPKFHVRRKAMDATSCFVAHGKNVSVAGWATNPPPEAGQ